MPFSGAITCCICLYACQLERVIYPFCANWGLETVSKEHKSAFQGDLREGHLACNLSVAIGKGESLPPPTCRSECSREAFGVYYDNWSMNSAFSLFNLYFT